jgi:predicted AAA+ superfamily ATPase
MKYRARIIDRELDRLLAAAGGVLIEGPRACGKTMSARQRAASEVRLDVDPVGPALAADPSLLLAGARPRLIDEWQLAPPLWDHVRRAVDDSAGETGQFIITGSADPPDSAVRHTGAGRIVRLRMRPMSSAETGRSSGACSLAALLDGEPVTGIAAEPGSLLAVAEEVVIGGWPALLGAAPDAARAVLEGYLSDVTRIELGRADGARRDPARLERFLRSYARHVATEASMVTIARDTGGADGAIDRETAAGYVRALERVFVIEELPAWGPHMRSRYPLRRAPKRHFVDPSLAAAALRAGPEALVDDPELLGLLFESLVVRDLRVYAQALGGAVAHHRDSSGLEIDAVIDLRDGRWGAFEVKLGAGRIDEAAAALLRFASAVDVDRSGAPAVLAVVTSTDHAYTRDDGVVVVPHRLLGP